MRILIVDDHALVRRGMSYVVKEGFPDADVVEADGAAILEIGWRQAEAVLALGREAGLGGLVERDLAGWDRAVVFRRIASVF